MPVLVDDGVEPGLQPRTEKLTINRVVNRHSGKRYILVLVDWAVSRKSSCLAMLESVVVLTILIADEVETLNGLRYSLAGVYFNSTNTVVTPATFLVPAFTTHTSLCSRFMQDSEILPSP